MKTIKYSFPFLLLLATLSCQPNLINKRSTKAPDIRVLLAEISQTVPISFHGTFVLYAEEATYELGKKNNRIDLSLLKNGFKLSNSNRIFSFRGEDIVRLSPQKNSSWFTFKNRSYKGDLLLSLNKTGKIAVVNKLNLEEYLKGVVPAEMPSGNSDYFEALKAQAVCARTYSLKKMLEHKEHSFDVYADVRDQVYAGREAESPLASEALRLTSGDILMYHDTLATVYYNSTCGGMTEAVQNVWPAAPEFPYLQPQKDILGDGFACAVSPLYRWERSFSIQELDSLFKRRFNTSFLNRAVSDTTRLVFKARVLNRSAQGRAQQMQLVYGDTSVVLKRFEIRRFFSKKNTGTLPSLFFTLSSNDSTINLSGGGSGHGVGMCQWGALNMSQKGFKYYDILVNKYFKGTYLKKVY